MLAVIDYISINVHVIYVRIVCPMHGRTHYSTTLLLKRNNGENVKKTIDIFIDHSIRAR
jgi:hypothetical protein